MKEETPKFEPETIPNSEKTEESLTKIDLNELKNVLDKAAEKENLSSPEDRERVEMVKEEVEKTGGILRKIGGSKKFSGLVCAGFLALSLLAAAPKEAEARGRHYGRHYSQGQQWAAVAATTALAIFGGSFEIRYGGVGYGRYGGYGGYGGYGEWREDTRERERTTREIERERTRAETERIRIEAQMERERMRQETELRREELKLEKELARAKSNKERELIHSRMEIIKEALRSKGNKQVELKMGGETDTVRVSGEEEKQK